jgi:hypothetical protein
MKKLLLTSIVSVAATTCFAQPARVQVINNSPDSTFTAVDVYFDVSPEVNDLIYRGATPFKDIPQTGMPVRISLTPMMGMYPADTFFSTVTTFTPGGKYVLVINGTKDQARYTPAVPLKIDVYSGAKETAANPTETEILFAHGSSDLGTSDYRVGFGLIEDNLSFGSFGAGYKKFQSMLPPPAQRILRLTNPNGSKTTSAYELNLMPFNGQAVVALPSGFVNPALNRNGRPLSVLIVSAAGQVMNLGPTSSDVSRIQFIHNSPDAMTSTVDVYINDSLALNNASFRTATPFVDIFANTNITIGVAPSTSSSVADTFYSMEVSLDPAKTYIGVLHGLESTTGYNPLKPLKLSLQENAKEAAASGSMVDVQVFHGGTDAPDIDIQDGNNLVLINDLGYGNFNNYISVAPAPATINVTQSTGQFMRRYSAVLTGFGGQAGTILASGFLDSTANSNGRKFGLFLAPTIGGPLVALTEVSVGVKDAKNTASNIKLFPNPAAAQVYITGTTSDNAIAIVCDMTGKEVLQFDDLSRAVDVSRLASGIYVLKVQDGEHMYYQKFSKQ